VAKVIYLFKAKFPWDGRLVKICNALKKNGNEVLVVARWRGEKSRTEVWNNLNVWRACYGVPSSLSMPFPDNPFWRESLRRIFEDFKPDAVVVREIFLVKATKKALGGRSIPIILDMAEHYPAAVREWRKYNKFFLTRWLVHDFKLVDRWEKESVSLADGIITVCDEQKDRLVAQYNYPPEKIEIIYNTPELQLFEDVRKTPRSKPRVFVHHGYHTSEKPVDKFLQYFLEFAKPEDGFQLIIAGEGDSIPHLRQMAEERNAKNVHFTGFYTLEELPRILEQADIGVVPYPPSEFNNFTLHNKVFDYLACGIPIVTSDAPPLKRLVEETKAGVALPVERDAVRSFFENIDQYDWHEMSNNAIKFAKEKYNWEVDSLKLIRFVEKIVYG